MSYDELKMTVKLDKVHKFDLNVDLDIDKSDLNNELSHQPAQFAWYATLNEFAKSKVQTLKNELEILEAELDHKTRKTWDVDSQGKMTEAGVAAAIKLTASHQQKTELYLEAQKNQGILNVAKLAFEQRHGMLISIAANMRGEGDVELKVNKAKVAETIKNLRKSK